MVESMQAELDAKEYGKMLRRILIFEEEEGLCQECERMEH